VRFIVLHSLRGNHYLENLIVGRLSLLAFGGTFVVDCFPLRAILVIIFWTKDQRPHKIIVMLANAFINSASQNAGELIWPYLANSRI